MNLSGYEVHPAANEFPMLEPGRLKELADDIAANGLRLPIQLLDGKIIDGRNRAKACEILGIAPKVETVSCHNPFRHVWSLNGQRRDLGDIQRGVIFLSCEQGSNTWEKAKREAEERGRAAKAEERARRDAPPNPSGANQFEKRLDKRNDSASLTSLPDKPVNKQDHSKRSSATVAEIAGIPRASLEKSITIFNAGPEVAESVAMGQTKPTEALRQIRNSKKIERVKALPEGQYHIIYADPPWQYNDKRETGDHRESTGADHHYPTMPLSELKSLGVNRLAGPDCVLFCWATFPLLPDAFDLVKSWGFTYKTAFVWDKGSGAFGHYHNAAAELLLVATRGSGTPQTHEKREDQVHAVKKQEHSRKPDFWRELIDKLYPYGPRIELFRRGEAPPGWDAWGAETVVEEQA